MGKKRYHIAIWSLIVLCLSLVLWSIQLSEMLSLYPTGDKIYEQTENNDIYSIIRYELENDFVLLCTYKNGSIVNLTVHNRETQTTGTAHSSESRANIK